MTTFLHAAACLVLAALVAAAPAEGSASPSDLRQVIVLSRHGVRGPYGLGTETPSEELLKQYVRNPDMHLPLSAMAWGTSETEDPSEIVSPKLTKHGYHVVERMGEYFRDYLYKDFLNATCKETFAYADNNERDNLTAAAFLSGLYPSCKELVPITKQTRLLFEQGQDPTPDCPVCSKAVYEGITGSNDTRYILQEIHDEVEQVNELLQCCEASICTADPTSKDASSPTCDLFGVPTQWNGAFYLPWKDTLSNTDYFSEWMLLQSLNNMSLPAELSFEKILSLAKIHETHMDLITNEVNSASFGATLLAHLTASFEQSIMGKPLPVAEGDGPHLLQSPDNRLLYYAAHDINLLYVRNLLRLQWYSKGWHPHQPVPGSMLVFELHSTSIESGAVTSSATARNLKTGDAESTRASWEKMKMIESVQTDDESRYFVKLYFVAASPQQMRNGEELSPENPPDRVQVIIPSCSKEVELAGGVKDVRCAFSTFKKLMGKTLKHSCVADTLRPFVDSLGGSKDSISDGSATTAGTPATAGVTESDEPDAIRQVSRTTSLETFLWTLFGVLMLCFGSLVAHHTYTRCTTRSDYGAIPAQQNTL